MDIGFFAGRLGNFLRPAWLFATGVILSAVISTAASASMCGQPAEPGRHAFSLNSGNAKRSGVYFVPSSYDGEKKMPVVFDFHGSNSNPDGQLTRSGWDRVAEREGFMAVALQGSLDGELPGTHAWNVPGVTFRDGGQDEAGFIRDAVTMILNRFCVDSARIYASGYSGGGRMLSQFLCNGNDQFAAAGFVASLRAGYPKEQDGVWAPDAASCAPARPVSIIAFAGLKDPANPYQGGGKAYWRYGGEVALKRWAELDGCKGSVKSEAGTAIIFSSYDVCKSGSRIFSYVIDGWGHAWPKSAMQPEVMKASADVQRKTTPDTLRQVDAADRMWDFFRNTDGQLVVGAAIKKDCGGQAVSASLTVKTSETTCSQPTKTSSKEPAAEGAL